jgi:hypothetical protein
MTTKTSILRLRLTPSIRAEAERLAEEEGISLNQFVARAVEEKLSVVRGTSYFAERKGRADWTAFEQLMTRADGVPPRHGDELPDDWTGATDPRP